MLTLVEMFRIGYFQGDIKLLLEDVACLRPTVFPMVPRLISRMHDKVSSSSVTSKTFFAVGYFHAIKFHAIISSCRRDS